MKEEGEKKQKFISCSYLFSYNEGKGAKNAIYRKKELLFYSESDKIITI